MAVRQTGQLVMVRHAIQAILVFDQLQLMLFTQRHIAGHVGKKIAAVNFQQHCT